MEALEDWATLQHAASKNELKPTLAQHKFDQDKVTITLMGDEHIGSKFYDEDFHKEILEWCYESKSPIILMGDELETATRDSVGAGIYEQNEIVDKQLEHFYHLYKPLAKEGLIVKKDINDEMNRLLQVKDEEEI